MSINRGLIIIFHVVSIHCSYGELKGKKKRKRKGLLPKAEGKALGASLDRE